MAGTILPSQRLVPGLIEKATGVPQKIANVEKASDEPKFSDMIGDLLQSVNQLGKESAQVQEAFLSGEPVELHQVMIKAEEAGLSMDLLLEIRNRLLAAYSEIMRMPL